MSVEFYWVAVAVVTVVSASRITRLLTFDKFPPALWLRNAYADLMDRSKYTRNWMLLLFCPWCASPWVTLGIVLWGWLTDFHLAWWLVNGTFAAAYLAAILMVHDGDNSGDEDEEDGS